MLSATLQLNSRGNTDESVNLYNELNQDRAIISQYDLIRDTDNSGFLSDVLLSFKRTIVPQKHEFTTEFRFNRATDDDYTILWGKPPRLRQRRQDDQPQGGSPFGT